MMVTNSGFPVILRRVRQNAHLTQRELAAAVGIDHTYLSKCERGHMTPAAETIRQLARVCDADAAELLTAAGKPPTEVLETRLRLLAETVKELSCPLDLGNVHLHSDGGGGSCRCGHCRLWRRGLELAEEVLSA